MLKRTLCQAQRPFSPVYAGQHPISTSSYIYTAKCGAYLHFTVVLNNGGKGAQSRRNGCSICAVEVRNLARNTQCARQLSLCRESTVSVIRFACAQVWASNCSISRSEQTPTPSKVSTLRASGYARLPSVPSRFMRKFICRLRLNEVSRQ